MSKWSAAFALQAASDLAAYELLSVSKLPSCHSLHYLQMWLEKLSKAYLYGDGLSNERRSHAVVENVLTLYIRQKLHNRQRNRVAAIRSLCHCVDLLHPSVNAGGRFEENVEYPWLTSSNEVGCPVRHDFTLASRLHTPEGVLLLKNAKELTQDALVRFSHQQNC